jgi:hypothetical protein
MKAQNLALLALLAAGGWSGVVYAQPYPPPPPPPDQGYGNPSYDDQDVPYYDDQGPENSYDNPAPYDSGYDNSYPQRGPLDVSIFYSNLSPYGRWIQRGGYGWVWEPTHVRVGWRPYTVGRWVNTEYGWTWVSYEPWGWATYHYGRWLFDPEYGWLWVPGTEWGPAWCAFHEGGGYIGWAPLPPSVGFRVGFGIQIGGLQLSAAITPYAFSFVPERAFLEARLDTFILPPARNVTFIRNTRNITNIRVVDNRIVNRSVPEQRIEQVTGRRVERFRVAEVRNPAQAPRGSQIQGNQVTLFRPAPTLAPARPNVTPQAVIREHQQRVQRVPQPAPGQPSQPAERWRRPEPQAQPARPQEQPTQPQVGQRPPRWQQPRQLPPPAELERKHQTEEQQLRARQNEERNRLQQEQQNEARDQRNQARARDVAAQHQAEMRAQQEQQQREQQLLQARQQRERQGTEARRNQGPPPNQRNQGQGQGQGQERRNQNRKDEERRRQQPPPPPPPGR